MTKCDAVPYFLVILLDPGVKDRHGLRGYTDADM
jgi:hypothetical protein